MRKGVLVIGSNLAGVQAALDIARSGIQVYLVERSPFLGQDSSGDLPDHLLRAHLLEATKHPNIEVLTCSEVIGLEGSTEGFGVRVRKNPRYVDLEKCIGCGVCEHECPVSGKRAIRVSAEGESRSRDRKLLL